MPFYIQSLAQVGNLFKVRFRLGLFDKSPNPLEKIRNASTVCTPYSAALSRDGVAQAVTLLKNAAGLEDLCQTPRLRSGPTVVPRPWRGLRAAPRTRTANTASRILALHPN